jgi:phospholipid/cholesterol/gamma-HCH transport system substrate-binding protein
MKTRRSIASLVILVACASTLVASGCSVALPGRHHFVARFQNTLGLYEGNDVDVLGFPVGKVESLKAKGTYVEVEISVDADVKLPADVQAVVLRPGIVTDRSVELTPVYSSGPQLQDGATIGLESTHQPVEYDELLTAVDDLMVALTPSDGSSHVVHDALKGFAGLVDGNGPKLRAALDGLAGASSVAAESSPDVKALLHDLSLVVGAVARNDALVRRFSGNLADVTRLFAEDGVSVNASFGALAGALRDVAAFIQGNRALILSNTKRALVTARTLSSRTRELTEIIDQMPLTLDNFHRAVDEKKRGLKGKVEWEETVLGMGALEQLCGQPAIPFLCSLIAGTSGRTGDGS